MKNLIILFRRQKFCYFRLIGKKEKTRGKLRVSHDDTNDTKIRSSIDDP